MLVNQFNVDFTAAYYAAGRAHDYAIEELLTGIFKRIAATWIVAVRNYQLLTYKESIIGK